MPTTYKMHRRVNAAVEFKGLRGLYILYAGGAIVAGLFLFALLYIAGVSNWICLVLCFGLTAACIGGIYHLNHRYGIHGWRKHRSAKKVPKLLRSGSRRIFMQLKK